MAVQAASLEILERAEFPAPQARAIVQAIELEISGAKETLATKQDILLLRHYMAEKLSGLELKIERWRGDARGEIHAVGAANMRQMYAAMLGQLAVLLGIAYFFVTHLTH